MPFNKLFDNSKSEFDICIRDKNNKCCYWCKKFLLCKDHCREERFKNEFNKSFIKRIDKMY